MITNLSLIGSQRQIALYSLVNSDTVSVCGNESSVLTCKSFKLVPAVFVVQITIEAADWQRNHRAAVFTLQTEKKKKQPTMLERGEERKL